jgi:hypothetical protein
MSVYYLVASLPMLEFGSNPPISSKEFLRDCERLLSRRDYLNILAASSEEESAGPGDGHLLRQWKKFSRDFRNEAAWFRAVRSGRDPLEHLRGQREADQAIGNALAEADKSPDPLSAEKVLDLLRWQKLDELTGQRYFDREFLVAYAIKLKILERYDQIDSWQGEKVFAGLKQAVLAAGFEGQDKGAA